MPKNRKRTAKDIAKTTGIASINIPFYPLLLLIVMAVTVIR